MTTNLEIINDALREINVISEVDNASSEQGKYALRKLNQLMEAWRESDVEVGWFTQTSTSATCPIPDWMEGPVTSALSVMCAPKYGASISVEAAAVADSLITMAKRKLISEKLQNADMSHLPFGAGHLGSGWDIQSDQ